MTERGPAPELPSLDDRIALIGVLQELSVAALDMLDTRYSVDAFLQKLAMRFSCNVTLCMEGGPDHGAPLRLCGAAGLSRYSRDLPLPPAPERMEHWDSLTLPFPETAVPNLERWVFQIPRSAELKDAPNGWLVLYFARPPRWPGMTRGLVERIAQIMAVAFSHRWMLAKLIKNEQNLLKLNNTLESRVKDRTHELANVNKQLTESLVQQRKTQEQLFQSNKLATLGQLAAVGQLSASLAHEINNPLAVILGFAQMMSRSIKPEDPLDLPIKSIEREAARCKSVVQDILTFSRKLSEDRKPMDVNPMAETALSLVQYNARLANVDIQTEFAGGLPPILGNSNQLQQVVINLAINAIDAMPQGGTLTLKTGMIVNKEQSQVGVWVCDTGCGIPPQVIKKMFEPFFTTKPSGKGTGLGLSLAYETIQQHQGSIEVQTEQGKGTTFLIRLPIAGSTSETQEATQRDSSTLI